MGLQIRSLKVDPNLCAGCYVCTLICSFSKFKVFNPRLSLLRIDYNYKIGRLEGYALCNQCGNCISVCPTKAIYMDFSGIVRIEHSKCIKCLSCVSACPNNVIVVYNGIPYKCDLCDGDPQCVKFCLVGALHV